MLHSALKLIALRRQIAFDEYLEYVTAVFLLEDRVINSRFEALQMIEVRQIFPALSNTQI